MTARAAGYDVEIFDDSGNLVDVAGPFDDHEDAELAAERIERLVGAL